MSANQYESELRFIVTDEAELERRLLLQSSPVTDQYVVSDEWYVPQHIRTYEAHELWLDSGSAIPIRLRVLARPHEKRVLLEIKTPAELGDYSLLKEISMEVNDETAARHFLKELNLDAIISLQKRRTVYQLDQNIACSIDRYSDGSTILEVEVAGDTAELGMAQDIANASRHLVLDIARPLPRSAVLYFIDRHLSEAN